MHVRCTSSLKLVGSLFGSFLFSFFTLVRFLGSYGGVHVRLTTSFPLGCTFSVTLVLRRVFQWQLSNNKLPGQLIHLFFCFVNVVFCFIEILIVKTATLSAFTVQTDVNYRSIRGQVVRRAA